MKKILALALLLGACAQPEPTEVPSQEQLQENLDILAQNLVEPNREVLTSLVHDKLTYGHSSGTIETKSQFIDALYTGTDVLTWEMSDLNQEQVGNTAWVRHKLNADVVTEGDTSSIELKVLLVWVYENGNWKLMARQAVK